MFQKIKEILLGKRNYLASTPRDFTFSDWRLALVATRDALGNKRTGILAAGIAFFATLAFFPLMAASVAITSFFISPESIGEITKAVQSYLPADIANLISTQLEQAQKNESTNVLIAVIGLALALFSISGAFLNLVSALDVSYETDDRTDLIKSRLNSFLLMAGGFLTGVVVIILLLLNTPVMTGIGVPYWLSLILSSFRWVVLIAVVAVFLAFVYRYGPNKSNPKWQWVTWGSLIAALFWMLGTVLFFIYARYFANFSDSYSLFAGIIALMTWLNLSSYIVLLGAEINNQLERQTVRPKS